MPLLHYMYTGEIPVVNSADRQASIADLVLLKTCSRVVLDCSAFTCISYWTKARTDAFCTRIHRVQMHFVLDFSEFRCISYLATVRSDAFHILLQRVQNAAELLQLHGCVIAAPLQQSASVEHAVPPSGAASDRSATMSRGGAQNPKGKMVPQQKRTYRRTKPKPKPTESSIR